MAIFVMQTRGLRSNYIARRRDETESRPSWKSGLHRPYPEGGDNSVSSFRVGDDGRLTQLDVKPTGNPVEGRSGTAKSLAYAPSKGIRFVLHSFCADHIRLMSVDADRKLAARPELYSANTKDKTDRVPTMGPEPPDGNPLPPGNVRARWGAMSVAYRPDTLATFHQRLPAP